MVDVITLTVIPRSLENCFTLKENGKIVKLDKNRIDND